MKKTNRSHKKNGPAHNANHAQKKISSFFSNIPKDEVLKDTDDKIDDIAVISKKRKMTTDMELEESQSKIIKRNDKLDAHNLNRIQKQLEESNVIHDVFSDEKIHIKSPSPNKNVVLVESKENIDLDGYKLNESKQFIRNNSVLHESNFENISVNQITTGSTQSSRMSTNSKQSDEFGKCKEESDFALNTCIADDFNDCFEEEWSLVNQINFDSLQRCKVTSVKRECNSILLSVKQEDSASSGTVICSGFWKDAKVEKDDIVAIQARKDNQSWVVDNTSGFIVVHADLLISGTTIVGALFCSRKAVLAEKFKKIETLPYYRGDATAMVIGSLAHQLLQKAIRTNIHDMSDIIKLMDSILQSKETIRTLYASEIAFDACRKEMLVFVPRIFEFIQHYLKDKKQQDINNRKDNFKGNITYVHDIEENIWLPKLGVKGKVDVTVEVNLNSRRKIMPLEIKTGRPSFSLEHKGQIILYIMMMALTGQDTDTGLLLYLRENNMQEIRSGHPERRDLILLRNTLANYFAPKPIEKTSDLISELNGKTLELPEPINHHSACSKCSYNALCCAYLSRDTKIQLPESHPLTMLGKQILEKLKPAHIDYVMKWVTLLQMEESTQSSDNTLRYLWTLSPEKREAKKMCVCNLKVIGKVIECDSKYQHTFVRANFNETFSNVSISQTEFTENEYVLVSTDTNINLSAGFIVHLKEDSIIVLLDRNITKYGINESFHIDKYSSFGTLFASNLASVGGLIGDDEICERLRDIVIDKKPATFVKGLSRSVVHKSASIVQELNESQQRVILKVMTANDYILIKGMPGTGKTQTLVALIELLHVTGHSVLITAHTNSALDNILLKLLDKGIDFLRLGSSSISPLLKHKSDAYSSVNFNSPESLDAMYSSKNIVGVTCYGAHHALLGRRTFDVCIVDESAQALQPVVLRPLYSARKFVLAGDPDQLPPIVKSKAARKLGADESLFARLDSENNTVILPKQYRMNKSIMRLANKLTYNDKLEVGNTLIENATLDIADSRDLLKCGRWIQKVLSQDIDDSIIILNTGCTNDLKASIEISKKYPKSDQIYSNVWEAAVILKLSQTVVEMGIKPQSIGIIAPYRAHVNLLKGIIHKDIEVNTVDQYQGRDKDIIIYSCAKSLINNSDIKEDLEILGDHKRLTVAITRAKHKLIVIADKYTLSHYSPFKKLFVLVEEKNIINLHDEHDDFSWETVMSLL